MAKPVATYTVSLTIGALYLLMMLGAPFCVLSDAMDDHNGHRMDRSASVCGWMANLCDSAVLPSQGSGATVFQSVSGFFIASVTDVSEIDLPGYPARSPPVFLS